MREVARAMARHKEAGLDLAAFALNWSRPAAGTNLPDPWCRVAKVGRRERDCACGERIDEYQAAFTVLTGANRGERQRTYGYHCRSCGAGGGGNYDTRWVI